MILIAAGILMIAGVSLFGLREALRRIDCNKRNAAFSLRVRNVEQDAHKQLKVGSRKEDVTRFYTEHEIPFEVVSFTDVGSEAIGTLYTVGGCAPLGCGTDNALIGVRVRVDHEGTVTEQPEVISMYMDCL